MLRVNSTIAVVATGPLSFGCERAILTVFAGSFGFGLLADAAAAAFATTFAVAAFFDAAAFVVSDWVSERTACGLAMPRFSFSLA